MRHRDSPRNEITLALAGDTMLGRGVAEALAHDPAWPVIAADVAEIAADSDLFIVNLECCISERGSPWPEPGKAFFFRAPPQAAEMLARLGVDCVTLANNHALDFGAEALLDTLDYLRAAGIAWVGAGRDQDGARAGRVLEATGFRLGLIGLSDHPRDFAAAPDRPGIAFADLRRSPTVGWLPAALSGLGPTDAVLVSPHWGPNMRAEPVSHVRQSADALLEAGGTLVAGHSAHVFQGVRDRVLFDLGDFVDDYRVDPRLRNDLGLLFLVTLDGEALRRIEAVPLALDYCHTRLANRAEAEWVANRLELACAPFRSGVERAGDRLVISPPARSDPLKA
jgi:poly-gamma-glutamate synthesis protein (capsule biosynthesis protein)